MRQDATDGGLRWDLTAAASDRWSYIFVKLLPLLPELNIWNIFSLLSWFSEEKKTRKWRKIIVLTKPELSLLFNVLLNSQSWSEKPALQQSEGRECTGGFTSCQILWLSRLHLICTALILEFKQNSSQVAGYLEYHLFSKSWTTGVLGVQFAENRGGVDWVVLLWLTRDHLSIGARMKTLFARWGLQKHLQRQLQRGLQKLLQRKLQRRL